MGETWNRKNKRSVEPVREEITINELAKLMGVSVHQIRYFEEKKVLKPAYVGDNLYRMYGMEEVYQLAHILLLRKLGVPVGDTQAAMACSHGEENRELLLHADRRMEAEIQRLTDVRALIANILSEWQDTLSNGAAISRKHRQAVGLKRLLTQEEGSPLSARRLAEAAPRIPDLFEQDIYYLCGDQGSVSLWVQSLGEAEIALPEDDYLCMRREVESEEELKAYARELLRWADGQGVSVAGPVILIEKSYLSLFTGDKLHYELLVRVQP